MPEEFGYEKFMHRALELAALGRGRTSPNPMVGAVIVQDGEIIAEGWHMKAGENHAEVEALADAGDDAEGATIFINLEPCSHHGRTPPCAPQLVKAGIARVVVGMTDPNPVVSGRGISLLEEAGVEVITGVLEDECLKLNEAFVKHITTGLPFVLLKGAVTLDGKIAPIGRNSKWITCEESRERVHRYRGEMDAVLVGASTLIEDNATLTCRLQDKIKDPYRVVLDSALRIPEDTNFFKLAGDGKGIAITTDKAPGDRVRKMESAGVKVITVDKDANGRPALEPSLRALSEFGIKSVMVEGGGEVNFSFLNSGLVDKVSVFIAPKIFGGRGSVSFVGGEGFENVEGCVNLKDISIERIGSDLLVEGYIKKSSDPRS